MDLQHPSVFDLVKARVASLEILDHRTGENTGVTPGGFHVDPADNTPWYVKHHHNPEHAFSEHLTNQVYRALGHAAPHSMVLHKHDGAPVYFSKIIPGFKTLKDHAKEFANTPAYQEHVEKWQAKHPGRGYDPARLWRPHAPEVAHRFLGGMSADLLVNNSDLHQENVGLIHGKVPARIDNGSNMVHDAHGHDRDTYHSTMPTWDHTAAAIHAFGTEDQGADDAIEKTSFRRPQVKKILDLRDQHGGWQHFVDKHIPGAPASLRQRATDALHARTNMLAEAVGLPTSHAMTKSFAVQPLDLVKARVANLEILNHKTGARDGVTPGGFHQDPADNTPWYVKHHANPEHAYSEHLSNQIYRELGHAAPHSMVLHTGSGNPVYFSKVIPGFKTLAQHEKEHTKAGHNFQLNAWKYVHPDVSKKFLHGTAADMLVNNRDLHLNNIGVVNGKEPVRVDNGDNFYHGGSAAGIERSTAEKHTDGLGRPFYSTRPVHADAAQRIGVEKATGETVTHPDVLRPQVKKIVSLRDQHGGWRGFVDKHVPGAPEAFRRKAAEALEARTHHLIDHVTQRSEGRSARTIMNPTAAPSMPPSLEPKTPTLVQRVRALLHPGPT